MWPVRDFEGKLLEGWEREKSGNGLSYYIFHDGEHTQWDHPLLSSTFKEVFNCNSIKYVAYRTASKSRILQKLTQLHRVKLVTIVSQFDQHGFRENEELMSSEQLENLLLDIYSATIRDQPSSLNLRAVAEVTANVFMNIYDRTRTGAIRVTAGKIVLTLFCSARLQEKYKYLFRQFADHNNCISRKKLIEMLQDIAYISEYLCERPSFGSQLVELAAETCYRASDYTLGVSEDAFLGWLEKEPQTLVWISTLNRLITAETSVHDIKCNLCKVFPMTGLRYRCLRCLQFNVCQICFFTGQTNKRHKLYHPLQEYCYRSTSKEGTKAFMATIKNMFSKKTAVNTKQRYLPICPTPLNTLSKELISSPTTPDQMVEDEMSSKCASEDLIDNYEVPLDSRTVYYESLQRNEVNGKPHRDLKNIILHLEDENRQLKAEVDNFRNASTRVMGSNELHQGPSQTSLVDESAGIQLQIKLDRLKSVLMRLQSFYPENASKDEDFPPPPSRYESTPARTGSNQQVFNMETPVDPRYDCAISNISSAHSSPLHPLPPLSVTPHNWERTLGNLPAFAHRSLPLNSFQRAYPPNTPYHQPSVSTQRASARAILQGAPQEAPYNYAAPGNNQMQGGYYPNDYVRENGGLGLRRNDGGMGDSSSSGLGRIQGELESIIRQLEAIYPGCSAQQSMVSGNISEKCRLVTTASEINSILRGLVSQYAMPDSDSQLYSTDHIPNV